ncbi:DUF1269 domain-containing protein [Aeromicrobium sp.]|uniref:DUF1269 domain-containing protein n=1 Tax=Aeromicrobium sp. TaxID=1871063 RepID=UPI0028A9C20B|nr:DUF1269 domain-containing protein [Aeromicrobium sp.]
MSENVIPTGPADDAIVGAVTDGAYTLVVADFADTEAAWAAYKTLTSLEDGLTVDIEGVVVVKRGDDGKVEVQEVTDHSTRSGLKWGVVGGIALGVLFPPSLLGSTAVLGAAGAGIGRLRERHHRQDIATELESSIAVGHSGIVALVSDPREVKIAKALAAANFIVQRAVEDAVAADIKAAAKDSPSSD